MSRSSNRLWVGVVEADRDPSTGQRRRVKIKAETKTEAVRKMRAEQDRLSISAALQEPSVTLERFLRSWTADVVPTGSAPAPSPTTAR